MEVMEVQKGNLLTILVYHYVPDLIDSLKIRGLYVLCIVDRNIWRYLQTDTESISRESVQETVPWGFSLSH